MKKYMNYADAMEVLDNAITNNTRKCCGRNPATFEVIVEKGLLTLYLADQKPFSGTHDDVPPVVLSLHKVKINDNGLAKIADVIEMANDIANWLTVFQEGKLDGYGIYDDGNQVVRNELESALMVAANATEELLDYIAAVEESA